MRAKEELPECPVATAVSLIGGKWKLLILRNLKERPWRFNELQRSIDGISQKVLTDSLRQMMSDGLAYRHDYHEQPPPDLSEMNGKWSLQSPAYNWNAVPICLSCDVHVARFPASLALLRTGSSSEARIAIIAITTSSSISRNVQ